MGIRKRKGASWWWLPVWGALILNACSQDESATVTNAASASPYLAAIPSAPATTAALRVLQIAQREREGRNTLIVRFSAPLDATANWQGYVQVVRDDGGLVDGDWMLDDDRRVAWFRAIEPETRYRVTVHEQLPGLGGARLERGMTQVVTTRALRSVVTFDDQGSLLPAEYVRGLPVTTINVDAVDVDFHRVLPRRLPEFLASVSGSRSYLQWRADHLARMAELVHTARYELDPERNVRTARVLPFEGVAALSEPGVYLVVMRPAGRYHEDRRVTFFSVTDLGVQVRRYPGRLDVRVASLTTGRALGGVEVSLLTAQGEREVAGRTTPEGLATFADPSPEAKLVVAESGVHLTALSLSRPALDLSAFDLGARPQRTLELFVYGPRDLYRPGETLRLAALLRDGDGRLAVQTPLHAALRRPDGVTAREFVWQPQALAYYQTEYPIPASAPTGLWELDVQLPGGDRVVHGVRVEAFMPERLRVDLGPLAEQWLDAEATLALPVSAEYLYGAPASGNRVETLVRVTRDDAPLPSLPDFRFGRVDEPAAGLQFDGPETDLDGEGRATLSLASRWRDSQSPLVVETAVSVFESGGRAVTRKHRARVWPQGALPGIRPIFGEQNPPAESDVAFEVVLAEASGALTHGEIEAILVREDRDYFWQFDADRGWRWEYSESPYEVARTAETVTAASAARVTFPVAWGRYRLEVTDVASGRTATLRFHAGEDWYARWQRSADAGGRPDRVALTFDRAAYRPGDTARLRIVPPEDGEAEILVEGDRPLWRLRTPVSRAGTLVEIPVAESWSRHDLHVTATVVRPSGRDRVETPKRSLGLIHLPLDRSDRLAALSLTAPSDMRPDGTLRVEVSAQGVGREAYVTLAAVDVGVLAVTGFETPSASDHFFGRRRYGVEVRDVYAQVIETFDAPHAGIRFGGGAPESDVRRPSLDLDIVSLFSGPVALQNGRGVIDLDVPEFEGRLRLMALAFDGDRYGSAEAEVTVASPVVAQLSRPRFLAMGDRSQVALDLNNLSGDAQQLDVVWQVTGPVELEAPRTRVSLAHGERKTLTYAVTATAPVGEAVLDLSLTGLDGEPVQKRWRLGLRAAWPATTQRRVRVLAPEASLAVPDDWLGALAPSTVTAGWSVSARPELNLRAHLGQLLRYPYGCLEQTTSSGWPIALATPARQRRYELDALDNEERVARVAAALDRLAAKQRSTGAFGLWDRVDPEEPWLTAYAADFMSAARDAGFYVPERIFESTLNRLDAYLRRGAIVSARYGQDPRHYEAAYRAYAGYVLGLQGRAPLGALRSVRPVVEDGARSRLPLVHLGLALRMAGDQSRGDELLLAAKNVERSDDYLGDYGSALRDDALIVHLLLSAGAEATWAGDLAFGLVDRLRGAEYLSTQERNALFLAGIALESVSGEPWRARLAIGRETEEIAGVEPLRRSPAVDRWSQGMVITNLGKTPIQAGAHATGYGRTAPVAVAEGFQVERTYYDLDGSVLTSKRWPTGKLVLVHLKVAASQRSPDALLADLLPAGLELENQNLDTAISLQSMQIDGESIGDLRALTELRHEAFLDDRYVAAFDATPHRLHHFFYLVRAVTPGSYQIPSSFVEDMYQPSRRAVGADSGSLEILPR